MGAVVSRGLLEAAKADLAAEPMTTLVKNFGQNYDTIQALLWWKHRAKFLPMGGQMNHEGQGPGSGGAPELMAHHLRSKAEFEALDDHASPREAGPFQTPEELAPAYAE